MCVCPVCVCVSGVCERVCVCVFLVCVSESVCVLFLRCSPFPPCRTLTAVSIVSVLMAAFLPPALGSIRFSSVKPSGAAQRLRVETLWRVSSFG